MNILSRRTFLESAAMSGAALAVSGRDVAADDRAPINVGVIGTRHAHASGQVATIRKFDDHFQLVGVVEPDAAQRGRVQASAAYRNLPFLSESELFQTPGLRAVAVETAVRDLVPTARRCAARGLHVFLDKPAGQSLPEFRALVEELQRQGRVLQMGYMLRTNPAFRFLFDAAAQGWLGDLFAVHAEMSKAVDAGARRALAEYPGGAMFELGCHLIDPIVKLLGKPTRVTPHILHTRPAQDALADNMLAVFDYPQANAVVRSALNEVGGFQRRQFVVMGQNGTLEIRPLESNRVTLELSTPQGGYAAGRHTIECGDAGRYDGLWLDFAAAIRGETPLGWPPQHNLAVHETLLRACGLSID